MQMTSVPVPDSQLTLLKMPPKTLPPPAAGAPPPLPMATPEQRARIATSAKAFEAQLLSQLMQPMFEGLSTAAPFGGGEGEQTYRSFLIDAFAKQTVKAGGIGIAHTVMSEMLKLQGLQ